MPIEGFDKRLTGNGGAWKSRGPAASGRGPGQASKGHDSLSAWDRLGQWTQRRTTERGAETAAIGNAIQDHCRRDGDDDAFDHAPLFQRLDCAGREIDEPRTLTAAEDAPEIQRAVDDAAAYVTCGGFEEDILEHLARHGTPLHPQAGAPLVWEIQIDRLRAELQTFRSCGLECCAGSFKDLVVELALGSGSSAEGAAGRLARVAAYLDRPQVWAAMVCNANRAKLARFACQRLEDYAARLQDCVDTWYGGLVAGNTAGDITEADAAWLKREFGRLALAADPPELHGRMQFHDDYETLFEAARNLQEAFRKDAAWFMISGGSFNHRRRLAGRMMRGGRQVTDGDIADWHDSHFTATIRRYKAGRDA